MRQSLQSTFSAFCMNDRFDYLSPCTILEGREARRYDPFKDAPVEGQFDWGGFFRNLAVGILVAVGCIALAAIPGVGSLLTGALLGAALGAAGETIYMAHKESDDRHGGRVLHVGLCGGDADSLPVLEGAGLCRDQHRREHAPEGGVGGNGRPGGQGGLHF